VQPLPSAPLNAPVLSHFIQSVFQAMDFFLHAAAVNFELLLAGTARANPTALTRQVGPQTSKAREHVMKLRQLHLNLAFPRAGALREDVEDKLGAVDHLHIQPEDLAEIATLRGRKIVIENHKVGVGLATFRGQFLDFAGTDEGGGGG